MKRYVKRLLSFLTIPFLFCSTLVGVGYSLWKFNGEVGGSKSSSFDVQTETTSDFGYLVKNYMADDPSEEARRVNFLKADETHIYFYYDWYVHYVPNVDKTPTRGYLRFPLSITFTSIKVPLTTVRFTQGDGMLSILDLFNITYRPNGQTELKTFDSTVETELDETSSDGYTKTKTVYSGGWWNWNGINFTNGDENAAFTFSSDQFVMAFQSTYGTLSVSQKNEVRTATFLVLQNTTISFNFQTEILI